jgi:hypothetical protein
VSCLSCTVFNLRPHLTRNICNDVCWQVISLRREGSGIITTAKRGFPKRDSILYPDLRISYHEPSRSTILLLFTTIHVHSSQYAPGNSYVVRLQDVRDSWSGQASTTSCITMRITRRRTALTMPCLPGNVCTLTLCLQQTTETVHSRRRGVRTAHSL